MRLFPKLLLAFLAVVLVGVTAVSLLANQAAEREVRGFMFRGGMTTEAGLAQELAGYYQGRGSWEAVDGVLKPHGPGMMGGMMNQRIVVADVDGRVVADTGGRAGRTLAEAERATGVAIEVDGRRVGTLIADQSMMGGAGPEGDLLLRINRAIWLAALAAGGAALIVGSLLALGLVRPIQRLTAAAGRVAQGDLAQRVPAAGRDEIAELSAAFNTMTANLQQAEHQRRDLTADIAHELRNPLAILQGNLEAVLDGVLPPAAENLQPLLDQTHLLARLVDDLRTLALADAGRLSLDRAPADPAELVRSVVARFARQADARRITLTAEVAADLPTLALDAQRIEQVLGNLLSNALRHTPEGGAVQVEGRLAGEPVEYLQIAIADTGPGIQPDALPHIFERFYRVDKARARAEGGTGLGLAIARQLVEAHGGEIRAENRAEGGARILFRLPL